MDHIVRAMTADGFIRVSAVVSTDTVNEAQKRHDTYPVATAALGRTMSSALLLSWGLKGEGNITLRIFGDGPLGGIIVTADAHGKVKGYVQEPHVDLPLNDKGKLDVGGAVGQGQLFITKDIGLKEAYTGSVPLVSGEIGDDVARYLVDSEQTPSLVSVGVLVSPDLSVAASGGIIIQALPNAPDELLIQSEDHLQDIKPVSSLIKQGMNAKEIIAHYTAGMEIQYLEETPVSFHCHCNRDKISGLLKSLGKKDLIAIRDEDGQSEIVCHFCNEKHHFDYEALQALIDEIEQDEKHSEA